MPKDRNENIDAKSERPGHNPLLKYFKRYLQDIKSIRKNIKTDGFRAGLISSAKSPETRVTFFTTVFLILVLISPGNNNKPGGIYSSRDESVARIRDSLISAVPIDRYSSTVGGDESALGTMQRIAFIKDEETYAGSVFVRFVKLREARPDWAFDSLVTQIFGEVQSTFSIGTATYDKEPEELARLISEHEMNIAAAKYLYDGKFSTERLSNYASSLYGSYVHCFRTAYPSIEPALRKKIDSILKATVSNRACRIAIVNGSIQAGSGVDEMKQSLLELLEMDAV